MTNTGCLHPCKHLCLRHFSCLLVKPCWLWASKSLSRAHRGVLALSQEDSVSILFRQLCPSHRSGGLETEQTLHRIQIFTLMGQQATTPFTSRTCLEICLTHEWPHRHDVFHKAITTIRTTAVPTRKPVGYSRCTCNSFIPMGCKSHGNKLNQIIGIMNACCLLLSSQYALSIIF